MNEIKEGIKRMGFDAEMAENLSEIVRITREAAIEECARAAEGAIPSIQEHYGVAETVGAHIAARRIRALVSTSGEPNV